VRAYSFGSELFGGVLLLCFFVLTFGLTWRSFPKHAEHEVGIVAGIALVGFLWYLGLFDRRR
jgi:hypothetical protein